MKRKEKGGAVCERQNRGAAIVFKEKGRGLPKKKKGKKQRALLCVIRKKSAAVSFICEQCQVCVCGNNCVIVLEIDNWV